jgi:hypothetical protein
MAELMSLFLVDALYHFALVRRYPIPVIGAVDVAAFALGGYFATKYTIKFARKLDLGRTKEREERVTNPASLKSVSDM